MTKEEQIKIYKDMLKEFDYDKNTLEDTIQFLLYMSANLYQILNEKR